MADQTEVGGALAIAVAAREPVLLWGAPGTGKTSVIRAVAAAAGLPCETVISSIREPSDFAGLPVITHRPHTGSTDTGTPDARGGAHSHGVAGPAEASRQGGVAGAGGLADGARVDFAPPRWAVRLATAGRGVLFFDEVSTAPPAVQAALLRVVLERTVGDLTLPEQVSVVAAANPPEQAADGWDLSAPLANRFCHLDWPVDGRSVADGFAGGWPEPVPPRLPDGWERQVPVARAWVAGFLTVRPELALAVPEQTAGAGRAWPSPRSWDMAARLLAAADRVGGPTSLLIRGCVGDGAGVEFLTWLVESDLPDPERVLAEPELFELPARGDRAYAALSSVAAAVAAHPTGDRWHRGWRAFAHAAGAMPDVAAAAARALARCRPPGTAVPPEIDVFAPVLREAGLL